MDKIKVDICVMTRHSLWQILRDVFPEIDDERLDMVVDTITENRHTQKYPLFPVETHYSPESNNYIEDETLTEPVEE